MEGDLGRAGVVRRHEFGPRQIREDQFVRDREAAAGRTLREVVAA